MAQLRTGMRYKKVEKGAKLVFVDKKCTKEIDGFYLDHDQETDAKSEV